MKIKSNMWFRSRYTFLIIMLSFGYNISTQAQTTIPHLIHSNNLILFNDPSTLNYSTYPILKETIKKYFGTELILEVTNEFNKYSALVSSHSIEYQLDEQQTRTVTKTVRTASGNWYRAINITANDVLISSFNVLFKRDSVGHIVTEELQNADGIMLMKINYGYDPDDRVLNSKSVTYSEHESDYMNSHSFFSYDKQKRISKLYSESSPTSEYLTKHEIKLVRNNQQKLIEEKITSLIDTSDQPKQKPVTIKCQFTQFDHYQNWTQKNCDNITIDRTLNYYD